MADIELVIKIPKEIYKTSQIIDVKYEDVIQIPLEVIADGMPLPKGHGRLIDADELEEYKEMMITTNDECKYAVRMNNIRNIPTIIEADKESEDKE